MYCSRDHQVADRSRHASQCKAIKTSRKAVEREEQKLRDHPGDFMMQANPFESSVGHFWGLLPTRDYMRARYALVEALLEFKTLKAVESATDHVFEMLRLCHSDNLGVRYLVPPLLLRLGRDQQCYDFMKWWATCDRDDYYDCGDTSPPYLSYVNSDAFESSGFLNNGGLPNLSHVASMTLLKIKLLLELRHLRYSTFLASKLPQELVNTVRYFLITSDIISKDDNIMSLAKVEDLTRTLFFQIKSLFADVTKANKYFWRALVNPGAHSSAWPECYQAGSVEEVQVNLHYCYDSWSETPGAISIIKAQLMG